MLKPSPAKATTFSATVMGQKSLFLRIPIAGSKGRDFFSAEMFPKKNVILAMHGFLKSDLWVL